MVKIGIAGGAGYTAGELIRLLINHPEAEIVSIFSTSNAGNLVSDVHSDLLGVTDMRFSDSMKDEMDVLFLCLGHGKSSEFLSKNTFADTLKIIDLSNDFRLKEDATFNGRTFVYGIPEVNKEKIEQAENIANPGCFATAIQEALLPLAHNNLLKNEVHINATTGSTGAGQSLSKTTHFSWRNNNVSVYKAFTHQHLGEIGETLKQLDGETVPELNFIPVRGNFTRGILATAYTNSGIAVEEAFNLYQAYFKNHPFVHVSEKPIHLKQVVNTNNCIIHLAKHGNKLLITSVIDNLLKGASGQAIQNMNLMFGFDESTGLKLKASYF